MVSGLTISEEIKQTSKSLLLPGWGLVRVQETAPAKIFAGSEILLISATLSFYLKSEYELNNSIDYGSYTLTKDISEYPSDILLKMESYNSSDEYNASLYTKARQVYPNNIKKQIEYVESRTIPDSLSWNFKETEDRYNYSSMRANSRRFREFMLYSISGIAINHISSAVFTYFKSSEFFKPVEFNGGFGINSFRISVGVKF
jgi:hypothetical protein